jgi:GAF domain-containing protein/nitrogen-specific signal transduction histidine kinase
MFASLNLGIGLTLAGLVFVTLVWGLLRLLPRAPTSTVPKAQALPTGSDDSDDAVVMIRAGGRVDYFNARAREWFNLRESDTPDLERLLRRVRPPDDFLAVCAAPGQRRLNVEGRPVEVTSHQVPGAPPQMLLSFRSLELGPLAGLDGQELSSSVLKIVTDFSSSITSSLDLESVLRSILNSTLSLVAADALEVKTWDEASRSFVAYRFEEANGTGPVLVRSPESAFSSLTQQVIDTRAPLLLADATAAAAAQPGQGSIGFSSYLGIPLMAGPELVGLLEAGKSAGPAFTRRDLDLLRLVAGQTGAALRNAMLYEQERRRAAEFSGLAQVAQAVGAIREPDKLFARLVESLAPLFDADIVGFLLYDEGERSLAGQVPFRGLPAHIVQIYRARIPPGSEAEAILREHAPILTSNAAEDQTWRALGLHDVAVAASLRDSALIPLVSEGQAVGYFQLSHRKNGAAEFSEPELRLLQIVADQAATIIQNALLIRQSRDRVRRFETLRRVSDLAAFSATEDEALTYVVKEIARLFSSPVAAAFLLDQTSGQLHLHPSSGVGLPSEPQASFPSLFVDKPEYFQTVTGTQRPLLSGHLSLETGLLAFYRPLVEALGLESAMIVPLAARGRCLGELMVGSPKADFFSDLDLPLLATAGGQLASAMENLRLFGQTDDSLRRRLDQMASIARVSREMGASLSVDHLLTVIHDETIRATGAECGSILLIDPEVAIGDPRQLQSVGCEYGEKLSLLERTSIENRRSSVILDFKQEPSDPPHPGVSSALLVPVVNAGQSIGLIQLHASRPAAFDAGTLETAQALANQAAVALTNARQVQEERRQSELLRRRADTLEKFSRASYALNPALPLEESLASISQGIRESTPFRVVLMSVYEPETGMLRRVTGAGIAPETLAELQARKQQLSTLQQLLKPEFRISHSYYIPADQTPVLPADIHYVYAGKYSEAEVKQNAWDPDDFLLMPLEDAEGNPLGLISLDDPSNGLRPDRATIESMELFAGQAVQVLNNSRQMNELNGRIESLTSGLNRQQQLLSVTQNDLPVLLHKDLEQTIALHSLDRRAQRVRAGLMITESVSRQLDASSALLALGRETLTQLGMSFALLAESTAEGSRLVHVLGAVPGSINTEALFGQRNPLRTALQTGATILVPNLDENDEWRDSPLLGQLRAKGVVCLPVLVEGRPVAAMLAVSTEPLPAFTDEDRQVYYQIARQASVVLQNISLLNETRRRLHEVNILLEFSRTLSGLDPSQIVRALLDSSRHALTAAHAGVVLLWNEQTGSLEARAASGYADDDGMLRLSYRRGEALPGAVFATSQPRRVDEVDFPRDYVLKPETLGQYRRATGGRLPVSSLLVPIIVDVQSIGLIVLDNFNTVAAFTPEDEALMVSLSQQAALSLENVRLVHATTERAGQLEALNEVATAMTSSLQSDQLVAALLDQLNRVLPFDTATLWLRDADRLTVAAARGFTDSEKRLGLSVAATDSALFQEMAQTGQPISVGDVREDPRFPHVEAPRLSWLGIPMLAKGQLTGMLALEKWQASFYSRDQLQLGTTLASQAAIALENANLYEDSVRRAAELDERSQRLGLLNRFSSALSGLLDAGRILELTADELRRALGAGRVTAVSFEHGQAAWVAASPNPKRKLPQVLPDAPLFSRLRESLGVYSTANARTEADLLPLREFLGQDAKGLLVLPLAAGQDLLALLFAHNVGSDRFVATEIELARTIANQASIALENARLYQSTVHTAERLALLNQAGAEIGTQLDPEQIYSSIHRAAARLVRVDGFVISLLEEDQQDVETVYSTDMKRRLPGRLAPLGKELTSRVITTGEPVLLNGAGDLDLVKEASGGAGVEALSIMAVPLTLGNRTLGMLSTWSRQANAYSQEDLQILGTLANQAVVTIQNGRLFGETQRLAEELEQRVVERTAQLQREQQNTETLLRILTEVSSSLDLDRALNRTLSLLNDAVRAEQGSIMLLNAEDNLLHYRAGYGYVSDRIGQEEAGLTLRVGEGLAGWVVQNREAALVEDVRKDPRWMPSSSSSREHRSAVVAPLLVADDVIGVLMVFSRAKAYFTAESLTLVKAIASQVAVAINNAHLYELIRDQAERLGLMLRKEQEEASRSQAILQSVADGVLVTGPDNRVSFLNSSMQRILGAPAGQLLGHPVEEFGALFGEAGLTWLEAVRRWSKATAGFEAGDTYAERLDLADARVALIHLAPVVLQDDFLGTVSILRDITHEVEVDRLKSEFVATVSHELRTPMTAIKGYVEMLLMGAAGAINENQSHFLDIVRNNIDRLNSLVGDLLDVSRIEAGKVTLSPQALDLREIAQGVIAEMQHTSEEDKKPMTFSLKAPRELAPVLGDGERVRQIMSNLLDNAYHYTPENGSVEVHLHSQKKRGEVQVDIVDDGLGIPPDDRERIFERFHRGENPLVLATPGTGLGLSIVKQLVEMHHGRIWVKSDGVPGHGSTFSFTLPIYEAGRKAGSSPHSGEG